MPVTSVQQSFNAGELAPRLGGRFDLAKFRNGCRTMRNFVAHPQGAAYVRGGLRYVAGVKTHTERVRLVPFEYGIEQAYVLEFGNLYVRFYANGAQIEDGGVPVEVVTPYTTAQLRSLRFTQSADVLYIVHPSHAPRKLSRLLADGTSWSLAAINFKPMPTYEADTDYSGGTITIGMSAITGEDVTVRASADIFYEADAGRGIRIGAGLAYVKTYTDRKTVVVDVLDDYAAGYAQAAATSHISTIGTGWTITNTVVPLAVGDVVILTDGAQAGQMRTVATASGNTGTLDAAFSVDQSGRDWAKCAPAAAGDWLLTATPGADVYPSTKGAVNTVINLTLRDPGTTNTRNGWRSADVGKVALLHSGSVEILSITSASVAKGRVRAALVVDPLVAAAEGAWTLESDAWTAANGYPAAIAFYEQRLFLGGTTAFPTTIWGSQSGDYENFGPGVNAADAVEYKIAANTVNDLKWMMPTKALLLGTAGSEFRVLGGGSSPLTPTNVAVLNETTRGSADVTPVRVGHKLFFVQRSGRKVREIGYSLADDTFVTGDLTVLSDQLTEGGLVEIAYQQEPESILWAVRGDGVLLGCTYVPEQEVVAWHQHDTEGTFESACVIPDDANNRDELWVSVCRTINGATRRFVERLDPDRVNADAFAIYSGAATLTPSGFDHLNGEVVDGVADGFAFTGKTVSGGTITLDKAAAVVVAGLPYTATLIPNRPEYLDARGGATLGKRKHWVKVFLRLLDTQTITVNGDVVPMRSGSDPLGTAPAAFTGDVEIPTRGISKEGDITITRTKPLPATVLCIGGTLDVEA